MRPSDNKPPSPTEVISGWIPHDARWHLAARSAATLGEEPLRRYVTGLVDHHRDGDTQLVDEFDVRSIAAVREDLRTTGLHSVDWRRVRDALLVPLRAQGRV